MNVLIADLISLIVPCYNCSDTIGKCVESIFEGNDSNVEVLLVDDASTDSTPEVLLELHKKHPDRLRTIMLKDNAGPANARNKGAEQAKGEFLFFVDSDTELLPDTLTVFRKHIGDVDAVSGTYHPDPLNKGIAQEYKALFTHYMFSKDGIIEFEGFQTMCAGVRREPFEAVGGFNRNLRWGHDYEAEEFGYRLTSRYKGILVPQMMVKHHFPSFSPFVKTYFKRVSLWVEVFLRRRRFESGGTATFSTGLATIGLLMAVLLSIGACFWGVLIWPALLFWGQYMYGYAGLWIYALKYRPFFIFPAILCNIFFTLLLSVGACWAVVKVSLGRSAVVVNH
jgi:glycosyltransferase involved in cell wall biosynthesis